MSHSNRKRQASLISPNRGTAGRADKRNPGVREKTSYLGLAEIARHCDRFMVEHVPGWVCRDFGGRDCTEQIRKMAW